PKPGGGACAIKSGVAAATAGRKSLRRMILFLLKNANPKQKAKIVYRQSARREEAALKKSGARGSRAPGQNKHARSESEFETKHARTDASRPRGSGGTERIVGIDQCRVEGRRSAQIAELGVVEDVVGFESQHEHPLFAPYRNSPRDAGVEIHVTGTAKDIDTRVADGADRRFSKSGGIKVRGLADVVGRVVSARTGALARPDDLDAGAKTGGTGDVHRGVRPEARSKRRPRRRSRDARKHPVVRHNSQEFVVQQFAGLRELIRIVEVQDAPAILTFRPVVVFRIIRYQWLKTGEAHGSRPGEVRADFHAVLQPFSDSG